MPSRSKLFLTSRLAVTTTYVMLFTLPALPDPVQTLSKPRIVRNFLEYLTDV